MLNYNSLCNFVAVPPFSVQTWHDLYCQGKMETFCIVTSLGMKLPGIDVI